MKNSDKMQRLSANKFYSFVRNNLFSGLNREAITWASHPNRFYVKAIISDTFCISVVWFKILIENRGKTRPTLFCPQAVVFPSVSHIRACINKEGQRQVRSHHCIGRVPPISLFMKTGHHCIGEPPISLWSISFFWKHHTIGEPILKQDTLLPVVIDCCHVAQVYWYCWTSKTDKTRDQKPTPDQNVLPKVDYTAAKGFASMLKDFEQRGQQVAISSNCQSLLCSVLLSPLLCAQVFWLNCSPSVATTIKAIAGELFVPISGLHQVAVCDCAVCLYFVCLCVLCVLCVCVFCVCVLVIEALADQLSLWLFV